MNDITNGDRRGYNIIILLMTLCILGSGIMYDYYIITQPENLTVHFVLKPVPLTCMLVIAISYLLLYGSNIYGIFMTSSLVLCLLGDVLLMLYIPEVPEYSYKVVLLVGGGSFFIARLFLLLGFSLHPNNLKCYKSVESQRSYNSCSELGRWGVIKLILAGTTSILYTIGIMTYFILHTTGVLQFVLPFYCSMMGLNLFTAMLRVREFPEDETLSSQLKGTFGIILFTLSDTILFFDLFTHNVIYGNVVAISLYWIGMYFLTISLKRG